MAQEDRGSSAKLMGETLGAPLSGEQGMGIIREVIVADTDADLIVMGGYGHARAWELLLGGVTRTILGSMTVPVLMSH